MSYDVKLILTRTENPPDIIEILKEPQSIDLTEAIINNDFHIDMINECKTLLIPKIVDALKRTIAHYQLKHKAKLSVTELKDHFVIRVVEVPSQDFAKTTYYIDSTVEEFDFKNLIEKLKYKCYANGDYLATHIKNSVREYQLIELNNPKYLLTVYDLDLEKFDNKNTTVMILPFITCRDTDTRTRLMTDYISKAQTPRVIFVTIGYDYKDLSTKDVIESIEKYLQFFKIDYRESQDIITTDEEYRLRSKIVFNDDHFIVEDLFKPNSIVHRRLFFKENLKYVQTEMIFHKGEEKPEEKGSEVFQVFCDGIESIQNSVKKNKGSKLNVAILGSGCGSLSKYLTSRLSNMGLHCSITGIEIDEQVLAIGTKFFNMNTDSNCEYKKQDAYDFILSDTNNYDIVLLDIDDRINCPPPQFFLDTFIENAAKRLVKSDFGYLAINTLDMSDVSFENALEALRKKFELVKVAKCEHLSNKIIICQKPIV